MNEPAPSSRRCPHCGVANPPEAVSCASCKHSLPLAESEQPTGYLPAAPLPDSRKAPPDDREGPTELGGASGPPEPGGSETATEYSPASATGGAPRSLRDEGPLEVGQKLGRYRIIKLLGLGGMGAVYRAWDEELAVAVAVKIVRPEIATDPDAARDLEKRFKRELLLARQVTHPNVVRIHDMGEIGGIKFITMPYVDGVELSAILKENEGGLPVEQVLTVARGVVSGLVAAHRAGVVHRDLKPANIMVETGTGQAMIMDFGIARSSAAGDPAGTPGAHPPRDALASGLTMAGAIVGTLEYMAPEQFRGEAVDHRADVYAFGLILYDLLAGRRRKGSVRTAFEEAARREKKALPPLAEVRPGVPAPLERIVTRCIQPDPAARYATTEELAADLDRLDEHGRRRPLPKRFSRTFVAVASTAILAALVGTWQLARSRVPAEPPAPMSVLVADFDNRAGDPLFEGTLGQALGIGIEGASFITVFPRKDALRSAAQIKAGSTLDESVARLVANREGINVVLSGSIEPRGASYAVTVKAQRPDGTLLSNATATASSKNDVLRVVGELASRMRRSLGDTAPPKPGETDTFTTVSLEAAHAYALGQESLATNKLAEAIDYYQQAVDLDPNLARAYAGLAVAHVNLKKQAEAGEYYKKALALVDRMTEREKGRTLGTYYLTVAGNYEQAIDTLRTHVARYPADAAAYTNLSTAYVRVGNMAESAVASRRATEITPRNLLRRYNYAMHSMYAGNLAVAVGEAERVLEQDPEYEVAYLTLALSALLQGDVSKAAETYGKLEKVNPVGASLSRMGLADLDMYAGRYRDSLGILSTGIAADEKEGNSGELAYKLVALAEAYNALGRKAAAAAAANKAVQASTLEGIHFLAARALIDAGEVARAEQLATALEGKLQKQTKSLALMIRGGVAMKRKRLSDAVDAYRDAQKAHDSWISRLLLGQAYVVAGPGHFPEALTQLETADKRASEATDLFDSDTTTLRYLPPLYYWLGRAQEGVGSSAAARKSYQRFIAVREHADSGDALLADARRRAVQ
jgi:serine/threonine protein kinase/tetratricopeptide (TPR) repeat protein